MPMRIMLADDHPQVRSALRLALDQVPGLTVVAEAGSAQAVRAQLPHAHIELLLIDWGLPGLISERLIPWIRRQDPGVEFQVAAVERLPYPDAQFDVVLSSLMLHHLPADLRRPAFAEIRRVLKPGGRLLVVDFRPPTGALGRGLTSMLLGHAMGESSLSDNLPFVQELGFIQVEHGPTGHPLLSYLSARTAPPLG